MILYRFIIKYLVQLVCDNMKKKIMIVLIICLILSAIIVIYNNMKSNLDDKALIYAKEYIINNNINFDKSLYIDIKNLNNNQEFNNCYNGSGVLVIREDDKLSYHSYLKCHNYSSKIRNKSRHLKLNGSSMLILNNDEEYIEPGYESNKDVYVFKNEYDKVKILSYYVIDDGKTLDSLDRIIIYTDKKDQYIDGNINNEYPQINLNGGSEIPVYYNSTFNDPGFNAFDNIDGDITKNVKIEGVVDTKNIGEYNLNYYVFNSKGNYISIKRIVRVISNVINYTHEVKLSTEERTSKVDIILTINGDGYYYTILPNEKTNKEKNIVYTVTKNDTYTFKIIDTNKEEKEILVRVDNIIDHEKIPTVFSINYQPASTTMAKVTSDKLSEYLVSKNYTSNNNDYKIIIDNETYNYNISSNKLSYSNDYVYCDFYMTEKSRLGSLDNTITLLAGSGERSDGPISNSRIPSNANLNDYSLLITIRKDDSYNMSKHPKMVSACTKLGMFFAGIDKGNSIIGFSEGAQAAARTVSYNMVKYDQIVFVNGSAYYTSDLTNLINNYVPFRDMEIILLECKNNNNWNETIIKTINDLLRNGVNSNQISLYTNDNTLINAFNSVINLNVLNNDWSGHGTGYKMIRESNILSYLSSK